MKIIIIGNGNYVTGKGTDEYGTILPAIYEFQRDTKLIKKVYLVGTNSKSSKKAKFKNKKIKHQSGLDLNIEILPTQASNDPNSYLKILNTQKDIDCAILATPDHTHYNIAKNSIERGIHTLVTKPLVPKLSQAKSLVNLCEKNNVYGAVEFHKRWDKQNLILKDKFDQKIIGDPLYTWTEYSQRKIVPEFFFKSWVSKNNVLQYLGIHYIDLIRFISRSKPLEVISLGQYNYLRKKNLKTYDSIQTIIKWRSPNGINFTQTLLLNWVDPNNTSAMSDQKIKIVGTKGRIELDQKNRGLRAISEKNNYEDINPDFCRRYGTTAGSIVWRGYGIDSVKTFLNDVIKIKKRNCTPSSFEKIRPTFRETLFSTAALEAANKSLSSNSSWKKILI
tara:strand:- start:1002 stop:2174 length:1173 start_codon:yes stop_codon:yes gene_type:complete